MYLMISNHIKLQIKQLRQKGYSLREIAKECNVAQSTVSLLTRNVKLSIAAKATLIKKTNQGRMKAVESNIRKRKGRQNDAVLVAEDLLSNFLLDRDTAFLVASISYECEGGKSNFGVLEFTNSDPLLVKIFLHTLRQSFDLDESKFRVVMHLHGYHKESEEKLFWSKVTAVPETQFTKTFNKKESGINIKDGYRGCVQIKYFDVRIKRTLLASKQLLANKMGL